MDPVDGSYDPWALIHCYLAHSAPALRLLRISHLNWHTVDWRHGEGHPLSEGLKQLDKMRFCVRPEPTIQ